MKAWRSLKGAEILHDVFDGKKFVDGKAAKTTTKLKQAAA